VKTIQQNILDVESGIICHQANTLGVMGAGLAKSIVIRWPHVLTEYKDYLEGLKQHNEEPLGHANMTLVDYRLHVCNLYGQNTIGRYAQHTQYWAVEKALNRLVGWIKEFGFNTPIYIPYNMGCGLAGGDWNEMLKILERTVPDCVICRL
jgi:O-acetyl-ADP-ribose deacetylase (regulator of RNase III)